MNRLNTTQQKELLGLLVLALLFVFPIIQANITFADDTTRAIVGYPSWIFLGRPLASLTSVLSSLGWIEHGILDIGALGQFLAASMLALSSYIFLQYLKCYHDVNSIWLAAIIIVNPYFLYNLSYRFDSLGMALGVLCTVVAFSLSARTVVSAIKTILLLVAALSFYQSDINLFIALAAIELILLSRNKEFFYIVKRMSMRAMQYCLAWILYSLTVAKIFMASHGRDGLISFDAAGLKTLLQNIQHYFNVFQDFFSPPICLLLFFFIVHVLYHFIKYQWHNNHKGLSIGCALFAFFMYCLSLSGPMFLLAENTASYRTMPAFYCFIGLFIALSISAKKHFSYSWIIPFYIAISISFQHGIVMKTQRDFEQRIFSMIHKDMLDANLDTIDSYVSGRMQRAKRTENIINSNTFINNSTGPSGSWVARALLIAQGLDNIIFQWPHEFKEYAPILHQQFCSITPQIIVSNSHYAIYRSNDTNLILLNQPLDSLCPTLING